MTPGKKSKHRPSRLRDLIKGRRFSLSFFFLSRKQRAHGRHCLLSTDNTTTDPCQNSPEQNSFARFSPSNRDHQEMNGPRARNGRASATIRYRERGPPAAGAAVSFRRTTRGALASNSKPTRWLHRLEGQRHFAPEQQRTTKRLPSVSSLKNKKRN